MKPSTISLRRRQLMIAGLVGAAAPVSGFAGQCAGFGNQLATAPAVAHFAASGVGKNLIVSGRVVDVTCNGVAGARVEVQSVAVSTVTDADGRFMLVMNAADAAASRGLAVRVGADGYRTASTQLRFGGAVAAEEVVAHLQRDETGIWRSSFGLTLA